MKRGLVGVQFGCPEGGGGEFLRGELRGDVRLSEKGTIDGQSSAVHLEDSRFGLYIDGEAGRRQEVVERVVASAEVGRASEGEIDVWVAEHFCAEVACF